MSESAIVCARASEGKFKRESMNGSISERVQVQDPKCKCVRAIQVQGQERVGERVSVSKYVRKCIMEEGVSGCK